VTLNDGNAVGGGNVRFGNQDFGFQEKQDHQIGNSIQEGFIIFKTLPN